MICYQIFTGAYGSFKEMTDRLEYIKWLGFDSIWITPFHESPSYHRYDVLDYYNVDPSLGTLDDLRHFIDEAHNLNIKVIMDVVFCHTSNKHKWFLDSRNGENDFYIWSDKLPSRGMWYPTPMNECSWNQCGMTGKWYLSPWGKHMAHLNINSWALREVMRDILYYWLDKGVDGFRFDAIKHADLTSNNNSLEFCKWLKHTCLSKNPDCFLVGEAWDEYEVTKHYTDALGSSFNFEAQWKLTNGESINGTKNDSYMLDNHDMDRISSVLHNDINKIKAAIDRLFEVDGHIFMYYGTEIGTLGTKHNGDENVRLPMDWDEVLKQMMDNDSLLHYVRDKIHHYKITKKLKLRRLI